MTQKITIVSPHLGHVRGGGEVNDLKIADSFTELDHDVSILTLQDKSKEFLSADHKIRTVECPYWYDRSYDLPEPAGKLLRHLNEEIFVRRVKSREGDYLRGRDLVLTTGRPILSRLRSSTAGQMLYSTHGRVNPLYDRYLSKNDGLVFWGGCEEEYENSCVLAKPHVTLDPAVDTDLFRPLPPENRIDTIPSGRITVGFVGRLEEVKRIHRIIDAVAALSDEYPLYLLIVGDGSRRAELESRAEEKLDSADFDFVGLVPREDIPRYLNSIDIFTMASRLENHPIALKEAIACGTFCVAPRLGRIPQLLSKGSGELYSPTAPSGLVNTLDDVLASGRLARGTRHSRSHFFNSWLDNARAILELHDSIAAE